MVLENCSKEHAPIAKIAAAKVRNMKMLQLIIQRSESYFSSVIVLDYAAQFASTKVLREREQGGPYCLCNDVEI